jgi:hypothetical protein
MFSKRVEFSGSTEIYVLLSLPSAVHLVKFSVGTVPEYLKKLRLDDKKSKLFFSGVTKKLDYLIIKYHQEDLLIWKPPHFKLVIQIIVLSFLV